MASNNLKSVKKVIHRPSSQHRKSLAHARRLSKETGPEFILKFGRHIRSLQTLVEPEETKKKLESKGPTELSPGSPAHYISSTRSLEAQGPLKSMFSNRVYPFRISTALNMSSSGAGIVNSTINMSVVQSSADYSSLSAIFEEFFIVRCDVKWMPVSRYQYPLGGSSTLSVANIPIGCAQLLNAAPVYSSMTSMTNNFGYQHHSTGDPFNYHWVNDQKPEGGILASTSGTQMWCSTTSGQTYTGALQFLSQSSPPALPFSQVLGVFAVHFECLFRTRE